MIATRIVPSMFVLLTVARADVVAIDVDRRADVAGGRSFGSAGKYERVAGTVRFSIDPSHPRNRNITDIGKAARNPDGRVDFRADVCIMRPAELSKGNGVVLFEVVNRGKKGMLSTFNRASSSEDPITAEDLGDAFLFHQGYTLVWVGWQHDVPRTKELMRVYPPIASGVQGLVRSEYTAIPGTTVIPLGDAGHVPYPVSDPGGVIVTVRSDIYGPRTPLSARDWTLDPKGRILLSRPAPAAGIYEVVYRSSDPPVTGVGLAAIRDLVSFLKRDHQYALGFGVSQSAMVLRALLYEGFNQDEGGKQVFDGILAHVAGGRRSTFQRFAQPSRTAGPLRNASASTTEEFPYSDVTQVDPATGRNDGLLAKATAAKVVPKIIYTNSSYEYWGSAASLLHTTPDGRADISLPPSTRMYVFAGGQHGPSRFPPETGQGRNPANFNDYRWPMCALLSRLHGWVARNEAPPQSLYPTIAARTLVPLERYAFPRIQGVAVPALIHVPRFIDFGERYMAEGIIGREPPSAGRAYTPLVPQADVDGNDTGGLRMPEIECAIGTFTGWNLRHPRVGLDQYLLGNTGSYLPFPRTSIEQKQSTDPRRPILDRFPDQSRYLACVDERSDALIAAGLLLPSDKRPISEAAARHWAWRMQTLGLPDSSRRESGEQP